MKGSGKHSLIILLIAFSSILPNINAAYDYETDHVWRARAALAWNRTNESYEKNPTKIISHLNMHVQRTLENLRSNNTRRGLTAATQYTGPCIATNPIDKCWRCQSDWAENRFKLADCALGFGYKAKGGKGGPIYVVNSTDDGDLMDPKPGTLRHACIQPGPLWITFASDMTIKLQQELIMTGDKTVDGRGAKVTIAGGAGLTVQFIKNVIIHGLHFTNIVKANGGTIRDSTTHFGTRTPSDGDAISIFGSQDVWVDHVSMSSCADGLVDAIMGSTGITLSNGHFTDHNDAFLFGANDGHTQDAKMQVTVAFNHFGKRMIQRMPRCRSGYVHVVNNDYTHWEMYAIGGSHNPTIISQGNRFVAPPHLPNAKEVTKRADAPESEWKTWTWRSEGDLFFNDAFFVQSGDADWSSKHPDVNDNMKPASAENVKELTQFAGALDCVVGKAC
jgi:pectate lyase